MHFDYITPLLKDAKSKIVLLILDGLGGLPIEPDGPTELEAATTPNMDRLAAEGTLGQIIPIRPGITPGSGPAHLALFGYDPLEYIVGRGALEASGVGMQINPGDVAVRGNFCTLGADGNISDRRAGRIPSDEAAPLVEKLKSIKIEGIEIEIKHLREHRFAVVMRAPGLDPAIQDTDPQQTGLTPFPARATHKNAEPTADIFNHWIAEAGVLLADQPKANGVTLRGFGSDPDLPKFKSIYGLEAACAAVYPMYRGVSRLAGMQVLEFDGESPAEEFAAASNAWNDHDFFFIHIKKTDSKGEDGDFPGKVEIIESVDAALTDLLKLNPDVLIITGDHSTPARMRQHSWHPVPLLLWAPKLGLADRQSSFGERNCAMGGLGIFPATEIMPLALAHAGRLNKFGA
ncbi:MAG: 2,3-bisphosphoglycerate-independent phosphoglycerate mutase [Chloroflexi bacterium]|nr:2,3-bisphosphoglycerate-independent phosphoglycerate mutase [Chloroflexota bacterium]